MNFCIIPNAVLQGEHSCLFRSLPFPHSLPSSLCFSLFTGGDRGCLNILWDAHLVMVQLHSGSATRPSWCPSVKTVTPKPSRVAGFLCLPSKTSSAICCFQDTRRIPPWVQIQESQSSVQGPEVALLRGQSEGLDADLPCSLRAVCESVWLMCPFIP